MRAPLAAIAFVACSIAAGCATYRDQLVHAQTAFEQTNYERTLALLRNLEPDFRRLRTPEQAEYAYLRGMTDYRVGYRADARHWLSIASAYDEASPGILPTDWKARTVEALDELDPVVQQEGYAALSAPRAEDEQTKKTKKTKKRVSD